MLAEVHWRSILLLLAGSLLIGLAHVALLPPFEGFDETAHYSYIQQLAQTGRWPQRGNAVSREIDVYQEALPALGFVPWNYAALFAGSDDEVARAKDFIKRAPSESRRWESGQGNNWQAQHPPLYYAVMTPLYQLTADWSLAHQLLALRTLSYLLAWGGLCVAVTSFGFAGGAYGEVRTLAVALWPLVFPMWFPEMARLGNDSLIILLTALAMPLIISVVSGRQVVWQHAVLGLLVGLGLLTKATFLPITVSIGVLLLFLACRARSFVAFRNLALLVLVASTVSAWWYVEKFVETANLIGSNDLANLRSTVADDSSGHLIAKLPLLLPQTFLWFGTWSGTFVPRSLSYLLLASSSILAVGMCFAVRRFGVDLVEKLALLTLALFLSALTYMAFVTRGITGGNAWYLHAFAPIFSVLLGMSLKYLMTSRVGRTLLKINCLFASCFILAVMIMGALFFSGCGTNEPHTIYLDLFSASACAFRVITLIERLNALSFPHLFVVLLLGGWLFALAGTIIMLRQSGPR